MKDIAVFESVERELNRQRNNIELIASENFVSPEILELAGTVLTNKYAEGYPGKRYYGGCKFVDEVETLAKERLCKIYGAEYANVQPHSGAQANTAVYMDVKVNTPDRLLKLSQVSRGTADQMYFAVRMAAGEVFTKGACMPVILDEAFAMYDDRRLFNTLKWLKKSGRQVILFTCHRREEEMMKRI